ncbi:MAG: LysE/ArgO family amino acid transporter [Pseudomonadota bacterium]
MIPDTGSVAGFVTGFLTGAALILAIGPQNALVLRQGLLREHVGPLVALCVAADTVLIFAGVAGFGAVVALLPWLPTVMLWAGALFLIWYGLSRLWAAWQGAYAPEEAQGATSLRQVLLTCAGFTFLNPHVYLDTLALMGAISTQFPTVQAKLAYAVGGSLASLVFFSALGYGARLLAPVMRSPRAWQRLDVLIGLVMLALAAKLLLDL